MTDRTSLAKRLIKDLVIPKPDDLGVNNRGKLSNNEISSDGYVIVSFRNRKKAQIQTATFSDVSKNSSEAMNILKNQANSTNQMCKTEEQNMPDEDSFYGEAFWIGSEDEEDGEGQDELKGSGGNCHIVSSNCNNNNITTTATITTNTGLSNTTPAATESDKSSLNNDNESINSHTIPNKQKMSRLTALSKGLLTTDLNNSVKKATGKHKSYFGDSRAVYYGGGEDGRKMLRCRECGKHYRNDYSLRHHICLRRKEVWKKGDVPKELVDGQLIYFCPTCSKPFRWMGNLTRHFYVHTGQRFFKCDICDKEFFSAYQVRRHMNSHTGMRYKCRICDKPFTCVYACTWHMRQHTTDLNNPISESVLSIPITSSSSSSETLASKMIASVPSNNNNNNNNNNTITANIKKSTSVKPDNNTEKI